MIDCRRITKTYRNGATTTTVLQEVTFRIVEGEFVAIMGPSGSGKSTLMNILGALDVPSSGEYFLRGQSVADLSDDALADTRRRNIGFVFQSFNLLRRATVLRNVMLPLVYAGIPRAERLVRARSALTLAGLPESHFLHRSNELSGGQMQRVAIARALVNDPAVILADEPTGNLDSATGAIVLQTFHALNVEHHRTVILITHERYVAEHANRILHIRDGRIVQDEHNGHRRSPEHQQTTI